MQIRQLWGVNALASLANKSSAVVASTLPRQNRIFIVRMTSDRKLEASERARNEGSMEPKTLDDTPQPSLCLTSFGLANLAIPEVDSPAAAARTLPNPGSAFKNKYFAEM